MSDNKSEHRISDSFKDDSYFGGESREQMLKKLRARVERFYERATREQNPGSYARGSIPFGSPRAVARASFEKDQLNAVLAPGYDVN